MPAKLRITLLALFWLVVSALTILAFAEIIRPHPVDTKHTKIDLLQKITSNINQPFNVILKIDEPVKDIQASLNLDTSNRHAIISSLQLPGNLESIYVDADKNLAYLANSFSGLQIIDISDPEHQRIVGSLPSPGKAWDIKLRGNILFLASAAEGLHLVDISSIEKPTIIANLKLEGYKFLGLTVVGNTVYVKTGSNGLLIIDVSDIKTPRLVKKLYSDKGAWGLLADKNRLFVSSGKSDLNIFDISDPNNPQKTGEISLPDRAWDMAICANVLYIPTRKAGLLIVDLKRPDKPELLRPLRELLAYDYIDLQSERAYITSRTGKLSIIDLSDPITPQLIGTYDLPNRVRDLTIADRLAYTAVGINGLQVIDTDALTPTDQVKKLNLPGSLKHVLYDDNFFYLATSSKDLYIANVDASGDPGSIIAHLALTGRVNKMVLVNNYLYLASTPAGLLIVDIAKPSAPVLVSAPIFAKNVNDLVTVGDQLFLATSLKGILIVDIKSPKNPELIGQFPLKNAKKLAVDDSYLYVSTQSDLYLFDYSIPSTLVPVGSLELPWPLQKFAGIKQITIAGQTAYLSAGPAGLISLDITNPQAPRLEEVTTLDGDLYAVVVKQNKIFALTRNGKLWLLQKDDTNNISRRAVIDTTGVGYGLLPFGDRMIIANGDKGLTILPLPQQLEFSNQTATSGLLTLRIPPQPNPGVYNLNLFTQGGLTEFIGAVELADAKE